MTRRDRRCFDVISFLGAAVAMIAMLIAGPALAADSGSKGALRATDAADGLLVFVGEKISLEDVTQEEEARARQAAPGKQLIFMDGIFRARYRVKYVVHGRYDGEIIEFRVADHYGEPAFSSYDTVMLFVSKGQEGFYHQKYQYYPVFRTSAGGWAGCGPVGVTDAEERQGIVVPHRIDFAADAYFDLRKLNWRLGRKDFASDHFTFERGRARCRLGNTPEELFEVKRRTVLKARGLFVESAATPL